MIKHNVLTDDLYRPRLKDMIGCQGDYINAIWLSVSITDIWNDHDCRICLLTLKLIKTLLVKPSLHLPRASYDFSICDFSYDV